MARIRTIKPELFRHEGLFEAEKEMGLPLRLSYPGLFCCADKEGRFRWRPRELKLDVIPYDDDVNFSRVLDALWARGFLVKYEVDGDVYGFIPTWKKHQVINNRERESELPAPETGTILSPNGNSNIPTRDARVNDASSTRHGNSQGEGEQEGKGREGEGKGNTVASEPRQHTDETPAERIFDHWKTVMGHPRALLEDKRQKAIKTALKWGYSEADICQAITGCSLTPHNMGQNEQGQRFDGLNVILKSADQIDRFIRNALDPPKPKTANGGAQNKQQQLEAANQQAVDAWLSGSERVIDGEVINA